MSTETILTHAELLEKINHGWAEFQAYIKTLSEQQLITPTDAAGWTVKDHLTHIAAWEDSIYALLNGKTRSEYMGVDLETWKSGNFDLINEVLRKRYAHLTVAETITRLATVHARVIEQLQTLSDADLAKPFNHFQKDSKYDQPVVGWMTGNTFEHYAEHIPWMAAIVA